MSTLLDLVEVQVGEEATPGTEVASYDSWPGRITSFSITPGNEEIMIADIGTRDEADVLLHGKENFPWEIEFAIQNWKWLYWSMGGIADSGTNPYTHALSLANSLPSLSIEAVLGAGDFSIKMLGSKVDTFDLSFVAGEVPKVRLSGFSRSGLVDTTPGNPSQLSTIPIQYHQTSTLTINGVSNKSKCERAQYQYKNNIAPEYGLASLAPAEILEGARGMVANFTLRVIDETQIMLRENYTDFALSHVITRAVNDTMTFTIGSAKTMKPSKSTPGGGGAFKLTLPCKVQGTWSASAVDAISVYTNPV